jgi:hypothetical protein
LGFVVTPFLYLRDRLFLGASALYGIHRWGVKPWISSALTRGQFNDLLLIPAALPVALWVQRKLRIRDHDRNPSWPEITLHLIVWSIICEWVGPKWFHRGTADILDVLAYGIGAILAGFWWHRNPGNPQPRLE